MSVPQPEGELDRLAALEEYSLLETEPQEAYDDIVRLAAFVCGAPIAAVTLIGAQRQWFKSLRGHSVRDIPRDQAFSAHVIRQTGVMVVPDAARDPRFADNPQVTGDPHIRFFAGAPLITAAGHAVGALCVIDHVPRTLTPAQADALQTLARQVMGQMELARRMAAQERLIVEREQTQAALQETHVRLFENEARLRLALESGRLGTYDLDPATGQYLAISDIYKAQYGLPPDAEFSLATLIARVHPDDRPRMKQTAEQAWAKNRGFQAEYRTVWPDGSIHWISAHTTLVPGHDGRSRHMIGVHQDITDQKKREQEVQNATLVLEVQKAQLETANAILAEQATRDPLTGLLNHRALHARLAADMARAEQDGTILAVAVLDLNDFRFFNDVYGSAVGDFALRLVADRLRTACGEADAVARFSGDEFTVLLPNVDPATTRRKVEARLRAALDRLFYEPPGEASAIPITVSVGAALYPQHGVDEAFPDRQDPLRRAEERLRRAKSGGEMETEADRIRAEAERSLSGFSMLDALVTAVDNKDRYTRRHSEDVMAYSLLIARELALGDDALQAIGRAALIHDVGKIGVPDSILRKPGPLTEAEFEAIKQHPMMGAIMVQAVPGLEDTLDAVRHHHERWDGGGYPFGLRGEETPLPARLMAVADAFSAMTTDRPYRRGMDRKKALALLSAGAGTQWDSACVRAFVSALHLHRG